MNIVKSVFGIIVLGTAISACGEEKVEAAPKLASDNAPIIQTPAPIIYLNDNLDEKDKLGWCIDTKGREFTEQLHAHSCKPAGDDVLFSYDDVSGQIRSATYANKCAQILAEDAEVDFGLLDCDGQNANQQFDYNELKQDLHSQTNG